MHGKQEICIKFWLENVTGETTLAS